MDEISFVHLYNQNRVKRLGLDAAIIFRYLLYLLQQNLRKKIFNKMTENYGHMKLKKRMPDFLGYLKENIMRKAIKNLMDYGLFIKRNFNNSHMDRTNWYTFFYQNLISENEGENK